MESSTTTEIWLERVAAWRAPRRLKVSARSPLGYAANTLRWWASKLKRAMAAPATGAPAAVQLARVVRTPTVTAVDPRGHAIVLDVIDAGVRIAVQPGADPTTLAMVLDLVRGGRA